MGFWDEYEEPTGSWVKADEKQVLMENGIPIRVVSLTKGDYQGEPRYIAEVRIPNPETGEDEERLIGFPIGTGVESRERMLAHMLEYLGREDAEDIVIKLEKVGRAILIRQA